MLPGGVGPACQERQLAQSLLGKHPRQRNVGISRGIARDLFQPLGGRVGQPLAQRDRARGMTELFLHFVDERADRVQRQRSLLEGNPGSIGREPGRRAGPLGVLIGAVPLDQCHPAHLFDSGRGDQRPQGKCG